MTDHVRIGEVQDDDVVLVLIKPLHELIGHEVGAHLRLLVVGCYLFRGRDQGAILTGERLFPAAVEEEGDVGVFLGLGDAQLGQPCIADHLREDVDQFLGPEGDGKIEGLVVAGHADIGGKPRPDIAGEAAESRIGKGAGYLAGAVGAEVEEDEAVAVLHPAHRDAPVHDHAGQNELVGHPIGVALPDGGLGAREGGPLAGDHGAVCLLDAVPAVVTVHGVVTADHRGDPAAAKARDLVLEVAQIVGAALRRGVAPVQQAVHENLGDALALGHFDEGVKMGVVGVHAAVGEKTGEVQPPRPRLRLFHAGDERRVREEVAVDDRLADPGQVLVHHAAGTDVGVADLGVTHLPDG